MTDTTERRFLDGSSSSKSYLVIALRGDIALGIRPLGLSDGSGMGAPGKSYLHARLRSCKAPTGMAAQYASDGEENVVKLGDQKLGFDEAWPNIDFTKRDDQRASTIVGVFLRGSVHHDAMKLVQRLEEEDFLLKMATYIAERVGPENMIMRPIAIAAWLHERLDPMVSHLKSQAAASGEFAQHVEEHLEVFGFQAALLNKLYSKHHPASHDPDDQDDGDPDD